MDNNKTSVTPSTGESRRNFIKKSSMVAGVSMIPASNVWGACNVTGVSGGSQSVNTNCVVPDFNGGLEPEDWEDFLKRAKCGDEFDEDDTEKVADLLSDVKKNDKFSSSKQKKVEYYYPLIQNFIKAQQIYIAGNGQDIKDKTIKVSDALKDDDLEGLIAATYLNGLFGMNEGLPLEFTGADGNRLFIDHIWGSAAINGEYNAKKALKDAYRDWDRVRITEAQLVTILGRI